MSWAANSLYTTNPSIEITTLSTDRWSVDFAGVLEAGESLDSAAVTVVQLDPPTYEAVAAFAGTATVALNVASFDVAGSALTRGRTYLMMTAGTLNTGKVAVLLTAIIVVA